MAADQVPTAIPNGLVIHDLPQLSRDWTERTLSMVQLAALRYDDTGDDHSATEVALPAEDLAEEQHRQDSCDDQLKILVDGEF